MNAGSKATLDQTNESSEREKSEGWEAYDVTQGLFGSISISITNTKCEALLNLSLDATEIWPETDNIVYGAA